MEFGAALCAAWKAIDGLPPGREVSAMRLALQDAQMWWDCLQAVEGAAYSVDLTVPHGLAYSEV